ncbi:MAG: hypothetical protein AB8I08_33465 [Sandaracinaceae bacterium]
MQPNPPGFPETQKAPTEGLAPLPLDAPPAMEMTFAFGVSRAFENGWLALKRAPIPMMIAGFLMAVLDGSNGGFNGSGGGNDYNTNSDSDTYSSLVDSVGVPLEAAFTDVFGDVLHPVAVWAQMGGPELTFILGAMLVMLLCVGTIVIAMTVARAFVRPGVIRLHSHILQTAETDSVAVIFSGSDRFLHMLGWEFMVMLIDLVVVVIACIPGVLLIVIGWSMDIVVLNILGTVLMALMFLVALLYVNLGLAFGAHLITLEDRSPIDALKRSWMLARGHRFWLFLFLLCGFILKFLAALLGILMCCVGLIATIPAAQAIADFAFTESFLLFTRGEDVSGYWQFWRMSDGQPPTPAGAPGGGDPMDAQLDAELRRHDN